MPPTPTPAPAPTLPDELIEEIFLRLPPDEPACLVRASLTSKPWFGLLTGAAFRGRYSDFHGAPPMLGFLLSWVSILDREEHPPPHFVSTAEFGARIPDKSKWGYSSYDSLDCRHGRVLLADSPLGSRKLAVWDPMTGRRRELDGSTAEFFGLGAAVLCAVTGCDHRACQQGRFRVLLFGLHMNEGQQRSAHARVLCSSETGTDQWSQPCSALHLSSERAVVIPRPSVLLDNALYNMILYPDDHISILKYDMASNCMSLLDGPPLPGAVTARSAVLMAMEGGRLGFAYLDCLAIYMWSMLIRSDGAAAWTQRRVVDLKQLLAIQNPNKLLGLIGCKEDSDIVFMTTDLGVYEINLKSLDGKKLWDSAKIRALIPYTSFYHPPGWNAHVTSFEPGAVLDTWRTRNGRLPPTVSLMVVTTAEQRGMPLCLNLT